MPSSAYREYECDVQEHRLTMHDGANPRMALLAECDEDARLARGAKSPLSLGLTTCVTSGPKDLHDSAVSLLGCNLSLPEWLGMTLADLEGGP